MKQAVQLLKKSNASYNKAKGKEANIFKDINESVEAYIEVGEYLEQAKREAEDEGEDFKELLETTCDFSDKHALKYRRVAKHKGHTRSLLTTAKEQGVGLTLDKIVKELPKLTEEVEITYADLAVDMGDVKAHKGSSKNDWHTPVKYMEAAREVMGGIDLDPFTSVQANARVKAKYIYTEADNGLTTDWKKVKSVWMNPPYSAGLATKCVDKFLEERGKFKKAIVLMNSATDTQWFDALDTECNALCFTRGRISFEDASGNGVSGNTKGQVFFYYGDDVNKFAKVFSEFGRVKLGGTYHA